MDNKNRLEFIAEVHQLAERLGTWLDGSEWRRHPVFQRELGKIEGFFGLCWDEEFDKPDHGGAVDAAHDYYCHCEPDYEDVM